MTTPRERSLVDCSGDVLRILVEDVEFMMNTGCVDSELVLTRLRRTGQATTFATLQRALHRAGRYDLTRRFVHDVRRSDVA